MKFDVIGAKYLDGYRVELTFRDRTKGTVDFSNYPERKGVFKKFTDLTFFKSFTVNRELGTLCWPNDIDLAPESLYERAS